MPPTPDADDSIRIDRTTTASEVRDFVERRATHPVEVDGVTVWNFSTHEVDRDALERVAPRLRRDAYIIPYQVPGAWGYMQDLLPKGLREKELLVYSERDDRYKAFPNFLRKSSAHENGATWVAITRWMLENRPSDMRRVEDDIP